MAIPSLKNWMIPSSPCSLKFFPFKAFLTSSAICRYSDTVPQFVVIGTEFLVCSESMLITLEAPMVRP